MQPTSEKRRQGINSIEIGMGILKALVDRGGSAGLGELAADTNMQPAKAHRYLVSLGRTGLVQQNPDSARYELGPWALSFSLSCLTRLEPVQVVSAQLGALVRAINESVYISVWTSNGPVVMDWKPADRPIAASTRPGTLFPLLSSSTGRTYAAYLPGSVVSPLIDRELKQLENPAGEMPQSRAEVDTLLAEIRQRGICRGMGIRQPGINSFTVPVFNFRSEIECVITAFGYAETFDSSWNGKTAQRLQATARELSSQLGHSHR